MFDTRFIASVALALTLGIAPVAFADTSSCPAVGSLSYSVWLSGAPFGDSGSPTGLGNGYVTFDPQTNQVHVALSTSGLGGTITGAGFYGAAGSGSPLFSFTDAANMFGTDGTFDRNVTLSPTFFNQIIANPANYSIGITTGEFPNGAISGTLVPMQTFGGTFSGASVVGTAGATNAGGSYTAQIIPSTSGTGSLLSYTVTPTGIGSSFTALELRQGIAGTSGSVFVLLSEGGTLSNGSYTGSIQLTAAQAQQLMANPSNFYIRVNNSEFASGAIRSQFGAVTNEYFIPVAGTVRGATGNRWQTDLLVTNLSTATPTTVTVQMLAGGQSNVFGNGAMNAAATGTFTIRAGGVSSLDNVLQTLFFTTNGIGGLRITSDHPIIVGAQIYDANQSNSNDTAQMINGLKRCEALTRGIITVRGAGGGGGNPFRSNVGFFNPNGVPVTVAFTMRSAQGNATGGTPTLTIPAYGQMQMPMMAANGLFPTAAINGTGTISFRASAPIFVYSSVVHAGNGDTHLTMAHEDETMPTISEADVASIAMALNQGEVTVNSAALQRLTSSAARTFAQRMVTEHAAALVQAQQVFAQAGITPAGNATASFITNVAQQTVASLNNSATGSQYDRAYARSQVTMHQVALTTIDMLLIPSAANAELQSFLQARRAAVAHHLAEAQQLLLSV